MCHFKHVYLLLVRELGLYLCFPLRCDAPDILSHQVANVELLQQLRGLQRTQRVSVYGLLVWCNAGQDTRFVFNQLQWLVDSEIH